MKHEISHRNRLLYQVASVRSVQNYRQKHAMIQKKNCKTLTIHYKKTVIKARIQSTTITIRRAAVPGRKVMQPQTKQKPPRSCIMSMLFMQPISLGRIRASKDCQLSSAAHVGEVHQINWLILRLSGQFDKCYQALGLKRLKSHTENIIIHFVFFQ